MTIQHDAIKGRSNLYIEAIIDKEIKIQDGWDPRADFSGEAHKRIRIKEWREKNPSLDLHLNPVEDILSAWVATRDGVEALLRSLDSQDLIKSDLLYTLEDEVRKLMAIIDNAEPEITELRHVQGLRWCHECEKYRAEVVEGVCWRHKDDSQT